MISNTIRISAGDEISSIWKYLAKSIGRYQLGLLASQKLSVSSILGVCWISEEKQLYCMSITKGADGEMSLVDFRRPTSHSSIDMVESIDLGRKSDKG